MITASLTPREWDLILDAAEQGIIDLDHEVQDEAYGALGSLDLQLSGQVYDRE